MGKENQSLPLYGFGTGKHAFLIWLQVGLFWLVCCKCHVFVHVWFCERPCLACLSVILRHRWGSSQPVSFIIPSNYSKNSFQSSCSSRSSLSPSIQPRIHPSIHQTYALFISFILPSECTKVSPTSPSSPTFMRSVLVMKRIESAIISKQ